MSMKIITAEQLVGLFAAYLCVSILLPHFVLGKTLHLRNRYEKFLIYTTIGNFYAINLVYYLELCKISNRFTLIFFTVVPALLIKIKLEDIPVIQYLLNFWETFRRIAGGQLGIKALSDARKPIRKGRIERIKAHFYDVYVNHMTDVIFIVLFFEGIFWIFGTNMFEYYGYKASDIIVHNYWINSLSENTIFVSGIYPYGFHCMCYYLHTVFGLETVTILRLFAFVQCTWVYMVLLCFLKCLLKTKFLPYLGAFTYLLADFYRYDTYCRFAASLPQEFGVIFILPGIYALMQYFREQRREDHGSKDKKARMYLVVFAMGFSLTLTIHFYGTAIAGLYCVGIAAGFVKWFVQKKYFKRIMVTGLLSLLIAASPMVIAFATGTELQGSLYWGLNIMTGGAFNEKLGLPANEPVEDNNETVEEPIDEHKAELIEEYGSVAGTVIYDAESISDNMDYNVLSLSNKNYAYLVIILPLLLLIIGGVVYVLARESDPIYGAVLLSSGAFTLLLVMMLNASLFHLPSIMDMARGGIYYSYISTICFVMIMDGVLFAVSYASRKKWAINLCSFAMVAILFIYVITHGGIREPVSMGGQETNDSVECLTHIIRDNDKFMWTIVSANDERQMANSSGFHYEIIDFLAGMEYYETAQKVMIPTPTVYFFIEKVPQAYNDSAYDDSQRISPEAADNALPIGKSIGVYQGENRMVVMSRLYAWCQAFSKLYPNEVTVYMENDNFICYRVEQNPYRLFNFAIDYGYNVNDYDLADNYAEAAAAAEAAEAAEAEKAGTD